MKNKQSIRINENQLNKIVSETIHSIIKEGYKKDFQTYYSTTHTLSYAIACACHAFGEINKLISQGNTEGAMKKCRDAYREVKGLMNDTSDDGNMVTGQYGAQPKPKFFYDGQQVGGWKDVKRMNGGM